MYSLVGNEIHRDKNKKFICLDIKAVLPVLTYYQIPPKDSRQILSELNHVGKIIHGVRKR